MGKGSLIYFQMNVLAYRCEIIHGNIMYIIWKVENGSYRLESIKLSNKYNESTITYWEHVFANIILRLPNELKDSEGWHLYEYPLHR